MSTQQQEMDKVRGKIHDQLTKYADKIIVPQYVPKLHNEGREEGEQWKDDNGKEWEMKDGFSRSIPKLQGAKTPWWCPQCTKPLNTKMHVKMWRIRQKCHRCVLEEETTMRLDGTYADYESRKTFENKIDFYKERIIELAYFLENLHAPEFQIFNEETGAMVMLEKWEVPLDQLRSDVGEELVRCNMLLTEMEEKYNERWTARAGSESNGDDEGEPT